MRALAGDDDVNAGRGNDRVAAGPGDDEVRGEGGADRLVGDVPNAGDRTSRDRVFGGAGADRLSAGDSRDRLHGGADDDRTHGNGGRDLRTRDGEPDNVDCGPGNHVARLDLVDVIVDATAENPNGSCERVVRAAPRPRDDGAENSTENPPGDSQRS